MDPGLQEAEGDPSSTNVNEVGEEMSELPSKKARGPSRGLKARKTKKKDLFWTTYFTPYGNSKSEFKSFLGSLAKVHCNINHKWKQVPEITKDSMWQEVKALYNLPDDQIIKKRVLEFINKQFRDFKHRLVSHFIIRNRPDGKLPYEVYDGMVSEEQWKIFYEDHTTPEAMEDVEKHRHSQSFNIYPHYLRQLGYEGIKPRWRDQGLLMKTLADGTEYIPSLSEPMDRADAWVFARTKKTERGFSVIPNQSTQQVADNITTLRAEVAEGLWTPKRQDDVLARAIGKAEHPGRVRGFGGEVRIRDIFPGPRSCQSRGISAEDFTRMAKELEERVTNQAMERMEKLFEEKYGFHPSQPPVSMSSSKANVNPSSVASDDPYPFKDAKDMTRCRLALNYDGSKEVIVAEGFLMRSSSDVLVHHQNLRPYHAKVNVDFVLHGYDETQLPVLHSECKTLQEAIGHFIQWPSQFIYIDNQIPSESSHKGEEKRDGMNNGTTESNAREPLVDKLTLKSMGPKCKKLHEHIMEMPPDIDGMKVICDKSVFGYDEDFELAVTFTDLSQMMSGAWLDSSIIHAFIMCLQQKMTETGISSISFLCPQKCCLEEVLKSPKVFKEYLLSKLTKDVDKRFFLIPYIQGKHWMLLVISSSEQKLLVFDPAGKGKNKVQIKNDIDVSFQKYRYEIKKNKAPFILRNVNCAMQPGGTECGYYVMRYMYDIVTKYHDSSCLLQDFKSSLSYEDKDIAMVVEELAEYFGSYATFV